jgi:hypothetical protein
MGKKKLSSAGANESIRLLTDLLIYSMSIVDLQVASVKAPSYGSNICQPLPLAG